ncbi:MAG: ABC transporter ATP-binding protein [Bacillota bacterium]
MPTTPQTVQPTATKAIIRASGLRKSFRMGDSIIEVLKQIDLTVREGEFLAIEGRSGSGKSTLMHLLGALDVPDGGTIDYEGTEFSAMSAAERSRLRNRHFGFVFQFYHLLPELNVLENTLLAPMIELSWGQFRSKRAELRERAANVLDQLGLGHRLKHRPALLSGGERQRVAIARSLMNSPRVLFADEPTGNLDTETGRQIMDVLEKLHREKGQTILMVTHDRSLAGEADRVLMLQNGHLVGDRK